MSDQPTEIEQKLIEFAAKTAETIQSQAGQIRALSHVLLIAIVSMSEQQAAFKKDFIDRIGMIRNQLSDQPVDQFTKDYIKELVRFLEDPYQYSKNDSADERPEWFKGIIAGGKLPAENNQESTPDE